MSGPSEYEIESSDVARMVVAQFVKDREEDKAHLFGLAGAPSHGKSDFARRMQNYHASTLEKSSWEKTEGVRVNRIVISHKKRDDVLIDISGEHFESLTKENQETHAEVVSGVLWPLLRHLDGIVLFLALPMDWQELNHTVTGTTADLSTVVPKARNAIEQTIATLAIDRISMFTTLLKYVLVAKSDENSASLPTRDDVDYLHKKCNPLDIPVVVLFSKADIFCTESRPGGLNAPRFELSSSLKKTPPINPSFCDPYALAWAHYPDLVNFMEEWMQVFRFDFVQVWNDTSSDPDPTSQADARSDQYDTTPMIGALSALEFVTAYDWTRMRSSQVNAARRRKKKRDEWVSADKLCAALAGDSRRGERGRA